MRIGEGLLDVPQLVVGGDDLGGLTCFSVDVRFGWLDQTGLLGASWWWPPTGSTHCARPGPSALPDGRHSHHSLRPLRSEWAERMLSGTAWQG
ncbi:hypothetical protein HMPREF9057_01931 [Actinomyces sp. oral taxon 171 str. F0337]|nr:hypothetical protein HMPREF9057_01931 [Actinomyces sp. oral taxon 171 str. F0337]